MGERSSAVEIGRARRFLALVWPSWVVVVGWV